jgi:HTH-type transcriptional regulator/antitoxin HigA
MNRWAIVIRPLRGLHCRGVEGMTMQNLDVSKTQAAWSSLAGRIYVPHSDKEYEHLVALLDSLIDEVGENESHPLASLMEIVGVLIEKYEDEHVPELAID